ncbi:MULTISPECIES: LPD7 domain-containing protein [Rhodomicrobium]|uniref:LPD7 domain-containing protein n=1 Tax=Rhodomicrobium TaxID=1068 RepID=UPI000B4BD495|nr:MULTISPECIES: LPD7 domain-containing protein [Rhodomicrobium]
MHSGKDVDRLWTEYQRRRADASAARERAIADIEERHQAKQKAANHSYRVCRDDTVGTHALTGAGKRSELAKLELALQIKLNSWRDEAHAACENANRTHELPNWIKFLREKAAHGDREALSILREREGRFSKAVKAVAYHDPAAEARMAIVEEFQPSIGANGDVIYSLLDGGKVANRGGSIDADRQSPFAVLLQLALYKATYPGHPMRVSGAEALNEAMVQMAVAYGVNIHFADPRHEVLRKDLRAIRDRGGVNVAILGFIAERNATFNPKDEGRVFKFFDGYNLGEAVFRGVVTLRNGSRAALLQYEFHTALKVVADEAEIAAIRAAAAVFVDRSAAPEQRKRRWGWW